MIETIVVVCRAVCYAVVLAWIALAFKYGNVAVGVLTISICVTTWALGYGVGIRYGGRR